MTNDTTDARFYRMAANSEAGNLRDVAASMRQAVWTLLTDDHEPVDVEHAATTFGALRTLAQEAEHVAFHAETLETIDSRATIFEEVTS